MHGLAVGGDQVGPEEVVHGQAEPAHGVSEPAAKGQPADPGVADDPGRGGQPELLGGPVQLAQQHPPGGAGGAAAPVDHGVAGDGVATAPDRGRQVALAGEPDGQGHVVGAGAAGDQGRAPVDGPVPDPAGLVVALLTRPQQRPTEPAQ